MLQRALRSGHYLVTDDFGSGERESVGVRTLGESSPKPMPIHLRSPPFGAWCLRSSSHAGNTSSNLAGVTKRSLRKREHRAEVQVLELGVVAVQLLNCFLLPKPVHVLAKRLRVDGLLVNVRLNQSIFLLLDAVQPPCQPRLLVGDLLLRLLLT